MGATFGSGGDVDAGQRVESSAPDTGASDARAQEDAPRPCASPRSCGADQTCGADGTCHASDCATTGCPSGYVCKSEAGILKCLTPTVDVDSGKPVDPGLLCGSHPSVPAYCTRGTQQCCVDATATTYLCRPLGTLCSGGTGVPVTCQSGADCPGATCCGTFVQGGGQRRVSCQAACKSPFVRFCDPSAKTIECDATQTCKKSDSLAGYFTCQ